MNLAHKIRIYPNKKQITNLKKACGVSRYTYNWALAKWNELYNQGIKTNGFELKKIWNQEKPEWVYESPKDANQRPFANLNKAFQRFFKKKARYPRFKKKGNNDSFYISNDKMVLKNGKINIYKIGWLKLSEELRFKGKILSATVSNKADQWFISITVDVIDYKKERTNDEIIGIDLGLKEAITCSNGIQIQAPKPFKKQKNKIAKLNRRLARKKKGSKNRNKQKVKLQKAYLKLSNIRNDFWHKVSSKLCNENQVICLEDLAVANMLKNHKLAFSLADVGLGVFYQLIEYKSKIWDNTINYVDRFFPSSKKCSNCGNIKDKLSLNERIYICEVCGFKLDRDINASKNIRTEGLSGTCLGNLANASGH